MGTPAFFRLSKTVILFHAALHLWSNQGSRNFKRRTFQRGARCGSNEMRELRDHDMPQ